MIITIIDTGLPVSILSLFSPSNLKMHPVNYYVTLLLLLVAVPVFPRVDFPFCSYNLIVCYTPWIASAFFSAEPGLSWNVEYEGPME